MNRIQPDNWTLYGFVDSMACRFRAGLGFSRCFGVA
jgi:hypothetical protein